MTRVKVLLEFDEMILGDDWFNKANLKQLLYTDTKTHDNLLEIIGYESNMKKQVADIVWSTIGNKLIVSDGYQWRKESALLILEKQTTFHGVKFNKNGLPNHVSLTENYEFMRLVDSFAQKNNIRYNGDLLFHTAKYIIARFELFAPLFNRKTI